MTTRPQIRHQATFDTIAEMDDAAAADGWQKVPDATCSAGFHYEKPPEGGIWWTRKLGVSRVGLCNIQWQVYSYT